MQTLVLFRAAPGAGKSTFIDTHGLRQYALSADELRMLCRSPQMTPDGSYQIDTNSESVVWSTLFSLLEQRMKNGEFTVIDATNSKTSEMNAYKKLCDKYRYRMYCVDMTDLPIEECKRRNASRVPLKVVPEDCIDKMYSRFKTQKIPSGITVLKPDEFDRVFFHKIDLSEYKKIVHIGDIHGCYTALMEYFKDGFRDDYFYIFLGDYTDRGIENAETLNFMMDAVQRKNVLALQGNHECYHKDTEVLTDRGWKSISEINADSDMVAQFNINTGVITFAHPSNTVHNFAESLIDIESFNMHQIVTPNHEVVYKYSKVKAKELLKETNLAQYDFPIYGNVDNCDYTISDDDLRFLVWVVSDATIVRQEGSIKTRIQFHLSRQDKIENLTQLMDKIGIKYTVRKCKDIPNRQQQYMICTYGDFARKYDSLLNHKKVYPEFFTQLSRRQALIVLDEIIKTDGYKKSNIITELSTVSKENADVIQTMCITHGVACTIKKHDNSCGFNKNGVIYR